MENIAQESKFKINGNVDVSDNMYVITYTDDTSPVPFPFDDNNESKVKAQRDLIEFVKNNNITVTNKNKYDFFNKIELITEKDLVDKIYEMEIYNLKREPLISFDSFCKAYEKIGEPVKYSKSEDPIKNYRHDIKRHQVFFHEIFGNNYRMFGLEDKFNYDNINKSDVGN